MKCTAEDAGTEDAAAGGRLLLPEGGDCIY